MAQTDGVLRFPETLARCPTSLDERVFDVPEDMAGDIEVSNAKVTLRAGREAAESARKAAAAIHGDLTRTEAAQHTEARRVALKVCAPVLKKFDEANARLAAAIARLESEIAAPKVAAGFIGSMRCASRQMALSSLPGAQRTAALNEALQSGDDLTLAAVLSEPAFVSGMSKMQQDELRLRWQQRACASELRRLQHLNTAKEALASGGRLLQRYMLSDLRKREYCVLRTGKLAELNAEVCWISCGSRRVFSSRVRELPPAPSVNHRCGSDTSTSRATLGRFFVTVSSSLRRIFFPRPGPCPRSSRASARPTFRRARYFALVFECSVQKIKVLLDSRELFYLGLCPVLPVTFINFGKQLPSLRAQPLLQALDDLDV